MTEKGPARSSPPPASIERALEGGALDPAAAVEPLDTAAHDAPTLALRLDACRVLGSLSGRAFHAPWEVAERAAFALLAIAREADAPAERVGLLHAMGRGYRNVWLMPYVHRRLFDRDPSVAAAAISAAGGLSFPALEEVVTSSFLSAEASPPLRRAAIAALGRMGAESAASRLVPFVGAGDPRDAAAALAALTEIRTRVGEAAALDVLAHDPPRSVLVAAVRYLAEVGHAGVMPMLRRLARDEDADLRIAAGLASRAFKAETARDADERILTALTERDRAVRGALARRLRTLPVADVLSHAEVLFSDDPKGVIQIVAEVRAPEVTKYLLRIAGDDAIDVETRARAVGSVEANEAWERDALVALARGDAPTPIRVTSAQSLGAFAPLAFVLEHIGPLGEDPEPAARAALLWAIQLAARPGAIANDERKRVEKIVRTALGDGDAMVRRRAAYVAGNLDAAALVPDLVALARSEADRADLRVAAFVGIGEIGSPARFTDLVFLWNREDDASALAAASRAIERTLAGSRDASVNASPAPDAPPSAVPSEAPASLARVHDRLRKLAGSGDAIVRAAAARVAGLSPGAVSTSALVGLAADPAPRVREQAAIALGRLGGDEAEAALVHALVDVDPAVQERAAEGLLALGTPAAVVRVVDFVSRAADRGAALRVAERIALPGGDREAIVTALRAALGRVREDHPAYETLVELKVEALESMRPPDSSPLSVDAAIAAAFPTWPRLSATRSFEPLAKSLRTAEMLYAAANRGADADLSASIVLWMKCLEGYMHAWLGPRLRALQTKPNVVWDLTDRLLGTSWPSYQRFLSERWADPVLVGSMSVEVPLRSVVNVLREFQERRLKSLDSPASVTEWSRLMLFFAIDHPSGPKNVLDVRARDAERGVRLAHRLQVLAQVRNAATHRSVATSSTLDEFRRSYYAAFEELTALA
ncbi:MAG: HEAT repeat domain-containing protein [Deltaproteobacteria bacterium]|nr:HEAT repeat domain-containing protein [Deltaproteobacteria bacterium]